MHPLICRCNGCRAGALRVSFVDPFTPEAEKRFCRKCGIPLAKANRSRLCFIHEQARRRSSLDASFAGKECAVKGCFGSCRDGHNYCQRHTRKSARYEDELLGVGSMA